MEPIAQGTLLRKRLFVLRVTIFSSLCGCSRAQWMLSKANTLHDYRTYNMGVHSCSATNSSLYAGPHTGCAFVLQYYHLRRGCVGTCERWDVQDTHQDFSQGRCWTMLAAPKGCWPSSELRPVELPRLARPKGCFATYYARSMDELSGRTTGRLGYDRPDSAYAIGGTAELALRYPN